MNAFVFCEQTQQKASALLLEARESASAVLDAADRRE